MDNLLEISDKLSNFPNLITLFYCETTERVQYKQNKKLLIEIVLKFPSHSLERRFTKCFAKVQTNFACSTIIAKLLKFIIQR